MNPFDIVTDLSYNKKNILESEKDYNAYMINRAFSYFPDSILYSNEMNKKWDLDNQLQHDYYFYSIPKKKRFSKWHKTQEDDDIDLLCKVYNINRQLAREYKRLLTKDQLEEIRKTITEGGT